MIAPIQPRALWAAALRSGEFQQTTGMLERIEGSDTEPVHSYCCLGVACVLYSRHVEPLPKEISDEDGIRKVLWDTKAGSLPDAVQEWLGLVTSEGEYGDEEEDGGGHSLTGYNDTDGWSFKQIADLIERAPEGLFT